MTTHHLRHLLADWCQSQDDLSEDLAQIKSLTDFLEQVLYNEYEPALVGAQGEFAARLARWLDGAETDADMRSLYLLIGRLVFFGRHQMMAGYRTAYSRNVALWLMEIEGLAFFDPDTEARVKAAVARTAFTEITDSFRLGDFLRWNNIAGHGPRYTWEQHRDRWDRAAFAQEVMRTNSATPRRHLVLMEDFIGSGNQMKTALERACNLSTDYNVLFCPVIICPDGALLARQLETTYPNLKYSPVMELPPDAFIGRHAVCGEHRHHARIRDALLSLHPKVRGTPGSWQQETPAFGYQHTGAIFCKYDNCPDNSLPILHHRSNLGWYPLFPRTAREG